MSGSIERYADLASTILAAPARLGPVRLVAVDGLAGSGKSTFAGRLATALRAAGADVAEIRTDDLLDGWADMTAFWPRLREWILEPLRHGEAGRYRRYDWERGGFDDVWHAVPAPDVLIVDGVTSARAAMPTALVLAIFLVADRELRLTRGIARDGEAMRAEWVRWMAGEDRHFTEDDTVRRVDLVVDGAPACEHDPEREFIRLPSPR